MITDIGMKAIGAGLAIISAGASSIGEGNLVAKASQGFGNNLSINDSFVIASPQPLRAKLDKAKIRNLDFFINESLQNN